MQNSRVKKDELEAREASKDAQGSSSEVRESSKANTIDRHLHLVQASTSELLGSSEHLAENFPFRVVGDLDGSYNNFLLLSKRYGVIDGRENWKARKETVVYLGDILADRFPDGFEVLEALIKLKKQANEVGGDVVVLAGNHEEFLFGYLTQQFVNLGSAYKTLEYHYQGLCSLDRLSCFGDLSMPDKILSAMQRHSAGLSYLRNMLEFKLCCRVGSSIFFHTPPTPGMLKFLQLANSLNESIAALNGRWRDCLTDLLLNSSPSPISAHDYRLLAGTFLSTGNDTYTSLARRFSVSISPELQKQVIEKHSHNIALDTPVLYTFLQAQGINRVIYGHSDGKLESYPGMEFLSVNRAGFQNKVPGFFSLGFF